MTFLCCVSYYSIYGHGLMLLSFSKLLVDKPKRHNILKQLVPIDTSWHSIGNGLGVDYNFLQGLTQPNMSNQTRLDHVLQKWIELNDQASPVNWKTIIDVVKGPLVQNKALAKEIYQYLKQESSKHQIVTSKVHLINIHLLYPCHIPSY